MKNHYFKTKVVKMGQWSTPSLDTETWYGEETSKYFKQLFGIPKGVLMLFVDSYMHGYIPVSYFGLLHNRINQINKRDYRGLEKKLKTFYRLDRKAKIEVGKVYKNPKALSNTKLAGSIARIRHWVHRVVIFDQFGWIGEEYWTPLMQNILVKKLGLVQGSTEYNEVLFALSKPERISTTLLEKKAVLEQAIKIKKYSPRLRLNHKIYNSAKFLADKFGWMPIFSFGDPWEAQHYKVELKEVLKENINVLIAKFEDLKSYREIRNREINRIISEYKLDSKSLQIFVDFGLALDTRNEAEYFVSYAGGYLMPLFKESCLRLYVSPKQLRDLTEVELFESLLGKKNLQDILAKKGKHQGWGYDKQMQKRFDFTSKEAEKLFKYIESYVKPVQGSDEGIGVCASPGKVTGKVRLVAYPEQNHKVKNGDILVSYATTVNYLPAMKRAAAIITEVGGLTCHAAVVSREFGIPCIVALKNAMKNFKDGDLVEVDADKGIVKKIK